MQTKVFHLHILGRRSGTLYIGMANDITRRTYEHKHDLIAGFSSRYRINRLVYVEEFNRVDEAIAREKQLKGWSRQKKIALIESSKLRDLGSQCAAIG